jgi:dolichol kinase
VSGPDALTRTGTAETARKVIHAAAGAGAAAVAWFAPPAAGRAVLVGAVLLALLIELLRTRVPAVRRRFDATVGHMVRPAERRTLTGATFLAIGAAFAVLSFPGRSAAIGILYAAFGDAAAALVGRRFGRHVYRPGRTAEGTAAFFSVTLLIGWATMDAGFVAAAVAAAGVTLVEAAPFPLNDNLLIPLAGAAACHWVTALPI